MTDGRELAVCSKHDGWVANCWFSRDSDMLVSVSNNIKVHTHYCTEVQMKGIINYKENNPIQNFF